MYRSGTWVMYDNQPAIVVTMTEPDIALLHFIDENGETVMRDAISEEAVCPQTGNPRSQVTEEILVPVTDIRLAEPNEIPASRQG